jgi:AMMECR1 domain-containing protein
MDDLKLLAAYSLFGINTISNPNLSMLAQRQIASKPFFGVFVTLYRNENVVSIMHDDNVDKRQIHGCLGHWNPNYKSMSPLDLTEKMQQLVKDVRNKDDRRLQFSTDVDEDASAVIEISFMKLPLREIDDGSPDVKTRFSNKTQGVLVDTGSGKRATYLPGVFPDSSWNYIAQSLRQKAGIGRSSAARFYAYDTMVVSFQVYDVLFSEYSLMCLRTDVAFFYLKKYDDFVPYEYNSATHAVKINESEDVRNVACIGDVILFAQDYKAAFENKPIIANLEHYYQKWLKNQTAYRQASIFLIRAYNRMEVHRSRVNLMSSILYSALDSGSLEPRFEMGEAVSVLAQVPVPRVKSLKRAMAVMRERADAMQRASTASLDNVFELNWQSQSVHQMLKLNYISSRDGMKTKERLHGKNKSVLNEVMTLQSDNVLRESIRLVEHALLLFTSLMKTLQRNVIRIDSLETNYLAVIYECLSNLDAVMVLLESKHPDKYDDAAIVMVHNEIRDKRLHYFAALKRGEYGLYYFKDGKTARLDITGHVISF